MALVFVGSFNLICNQFLGVSPFLFGNHYFLVVKIKGTCFSCAPFSLFPPGYILSVRRQERVVLHQEAEKVQNLRENTLSEAYWSKKIAKKNPVKYKIDI